MNQSKLRISIISFLLLILVACSNNDVEDHPTANDTDVDASASSTYTGSSNDGEFGGTEQVEFPDNFELNIDEGNNERPQNNDDNTRSPRWERNAARDRGETYQNQTEEENQQLSPEGLNEFEARVIELTNAEREEAGLSDLRADTALSRVAELKSRDMVNNNYFSHTSPTYGSPFDMMSDFEISYQSAGENIAHGQRSPQQVVDAWMGSQGHRANILNNDFTHIGVGYVNDGNYWTQMFIAK